MFELIFFIAFLLFVGILLVPIRYRIMVHCDLLHNHTLFSIRAVKQPVLFGSIRVSGNRLFLTTKKREIALKIIAPATDEESIASYVSPKLPKLSVKKINLYAQVGKSDDACFSALSSGVLRIVGVSAISVLKQYNKDMIFDYDFETLFNVDHIQITVNCIVSMSFANIIHAVWETFRHHNEVIIKN